MASNHRVAAYPPLVQGRPRFQYPGAEIAGSLVVNFIDQLKARLKQALTRFAARKTEEQAEGMAEEARGIVASTKDLARRNPVGFAALVGLGGLLLWLMVSRKRVQTEQ